MFHASTSLSHGYSVPHGGKQIAIRMKTETFEKLKARAIKEKKSMNAKLVEYLETGLDVDDEWDLDEPDRHLLKD